MKRTNKMTNGIFTILLCLTFVVFTGQVLAQCGSWETKTSMPTARYGPAIGVINDKLYVASGGIISNYYPWPRHTEVEAYDPTTDSWSTHTPIPTGIHGAVSGVINGKLYVAGGQADYLAGANQAILQVYDPVTDTWVMKAPMPARSSNMAGGVINNKLYVAGGMNPPNTGYVDTLLVYDPASNTWTTLAPLPAPRNAAAAGVIDNVLYVVGGGDSSSGYLATVEAYDPETDTWTTKAAMPTARALAEAAVINGILYVVGGYNNPSNFLTTVEAYNPATNTWTTEVPMPTARVMPAVGVVDNKLYAIGGKITQGDLGSTTNEVFTPPITEIPATIDIDPDVFKIKVGKDKGSEEPKDAFIRAFIELPAEVNVMDIDVETVTLSLNDTILATAESPLIVDNILDVLFRLNLTNVSTILDIEPAEIEVDDGMVKVKTTTDPSDSIDLIELTVSGELICGVNFAGTDAVRLMWE